MQRSRLKNIINKSKEISKPIGDFFEQFKKSLPKDLEIGENYRLKAAWEAYGKPKNYKEALWQGLILPIDENTIKWPSIGYNTKTDEYEYLNKGKENETVAKDIRVWDNDVIPFVQELKRGGYVRTYNELKECWTYSKNPQETEPIEEPEVIEALLKGGKTKNKQTYFEFLKTLPSNLLKGNTEDIDGRVNDLGYRMNLLFYNSPNIWSFLDALNNGIFTLESDGYHAPSIVEMPNGNYEFLKPFNHPTIYKEIDKYNNDPSMENFRKEYELLTTDPNGSPLKYYRYIKRNPKLFKLGGQMNVIPEGALHARKNNMEGAGEDFTAKGIPVMTADGKELVAEIEVNEIILNLETTLKIEEYYKKFKDTESKSELDEIAIKCGKMLAKSIIEDTDDRTNLIEEIKND